MEMQEILTFLESRQEELYAASDYIWDCAETAFREVKSSARLREILEKAWRECPPPLRLPMAKERR